jgi:hypothetical protein
MVLLNQSTQAKTKILEWVAKAKRSARAWLLLMSGQYGKWKFPQE